MAKELDQEKITPDESSVKKAEKAEKAEKSKDAKDDKAKAKKNGKPKKSIVQYFKDCRSEFKKVVWPTPKQTTNNTLVVVLFCALAGLFIFGIDTLFSLLNKLIMG